MSPKHLIEARAVSVIRDKKTLVDNADVDLLPGKIVSLIGPNGAGKTTLVKTLMGLINPNQGTINRRPNLSVGYMPQKLNVDSSLPITVQAFLSMSSVSQDKVTQLAEKTEITPILGSPLQSLSGGELQRALLCRALIRDPDLLVLDEPAQGVDVNGQAELYQLITQIRDEIGCGVLMVSHDLHFVMAATDEVICLNQHICCHGHPEKVSNHPEYLQLFGQTANATMAVYTHHHDHQHSVHGDVTHCDHSH